MRLVRQPDGLCDGTEVPVHALQANARPVAKVDQVRGETGQGAAAGRAAAPDGAGAEQWWALAWPDGDADVWLILLDGAAATAAATTVVDHFAATLVGIVSGRRQRAGASHGIRRVDLLGGIAVIAAAATTWAIFAVPVSRRWLSLLGFGHWFCGISILNIHMVHAAVIVSAVRPSRTAVVVLAGRRHGLEF